MTKDDVLIEIDAAIRAHVEIDAAMKANEDQQALLIKQRRELAPKLLEAADRVRAAQDAYYRIVSDLVVVITFPTWRTFDDLACRNALFELHRETPLGIRVSSYWYRHASGARSRFTASDERGMITGRLTTPREFVIDSLSR